jgi:hypothetical protein
MPPHCIRLKKTLKLIAHITRTGSHRTLDLKKQTPSLHPDLQKSCGALAASAVVRARCA